MNDKLNKILTILLSLTNEELDTLIKEFYRLKKQIKL